MTSFVVRNAQVLDEGGDFTGPIDVIVRDGLVERMGPSLPGAGLPDLDGAGRWLMPGLVDCHAHPAMWTRDRLRLLSTPITEWTLRAADAMQRTLRGGVTYLRDAGGADAGLRTGVERGLIDGPHIAISIVLLSQTGGQMDGFLTGPGIEDATGSLLPEYPGRPEWRADGPEDVRRAVRSILRAGADWIKVCAGTGAHVEGQDWNGVEYTEEELSMAVAEAARVGKSVMADAKTPASIAMCVRAGVRSIEHGLFLDEETARLMVENDVWLVPTLSVYRDLLSKHERGLLPPAISAAVLEMIERSRDQIAIARAAGVRMAMGSDAFGNEMHGRNATEPGFLQEQGMPVEEALLTATVRGAELCRVAGRRGRIAPGHAFDALVLTAEPSDLHLLARPGVIEAVYRDGIRHEADVEPPEDDR